MTYCINSECPFRDCEKHLSKSRSKGKVYVANFDGICKRYITCMLKECKECMKDAPHDYCCKLECGEHEFCRGCIDELLKDLAYNRQQYEKGYNKAIDDFKIRFFCELNNRVVRPIFSKQIQSKFTIDDIKSIFDEIVEQLRVGEQE